ncbi:MAG: metal-dependent hydrolase [Thaumarchaeota archaeon]|nr:metal-dependent hydrolase [Nitrososphaerota archaeon]
MDLPTHFAFGLLIGLVFFASKPEAVLLIGFGALLPDLDREYWYVREQKYADEQFHRARFHNVFIIVAAFLVSPFLSIGVFIHMLQDSFTTAKDRGVEWFYPATRFVKRGLYDPNMKPQKPDPKEKVYFFQEDPLGYVNAADVDLREGDAPVPWRRVYGFAQNSHLLDRGFAFGSLALIIVWLAFPTSLSYIQNSLSYIRGNFILWLVGYGSIALLYMAGETQRRDKLPRVPQLKPIQFPLLVVGVALLALWFVLYRVAIYQNLQIIFADPLIIIVGTITVPVVTYILVKWYTRGGKTAIV